MLTHCFQSANKSLLLLLLLSWENFQFIIKDLDWMINSPVLKVKQAILHRYCNLFREDVC